MTLKRDYLKILESAFCNGNTLPLKKLLSPECHYHSEYGDFDICGREEIIDFIDKSHSNVEEDSKDGYLGFIKSSSEIGTSELKEMNPNDVFLILHRFRSSEFPVAIVCIDIDINNEINKIVLSRDNKLFNIDFYSEKIEDDLIGDLPNTVKELKGMEIYLNNVIEENTFHSNDTLYKDGFYIWREADKYTRQFLNSHDYYLQDSNIFDDCIGYKVSRQNLEYVVYMFAYGKRKTAALDGDYCQKFKNYEYSKNRKILILYIHTKKYYVGLTPKYKCGSYCDSYPELWFLTEVNNQNILLYYPREELFKITEKLMYAFNNNDVDVYDSCIEVGSNIKSPDVFRGTFIKDELFKIRAQYGKMKYAYVRKNDVIYSKVPYVENFGYFSFSVNNENRDRISSVTVYKDHKYKELIITNEDSQYNIKNNIPLINRIEVMKPELYERFALKLYYEGGLTKKYVLPISIEDEYNEAIKFEKKVFSDSIWKTAKLLDHTTIYNDDENINAVSGQGIGFDNNFTISNVTLFEESTLYSEPNIVDEVVTDGDNYQIIKKWHWQAKFAYFNGFDDEVIKVLLTGNAFNYNGISTYATPDGKRLTHQDFEVMEDFGKKAALVYPYKKGFAIIDRNMKYVNNQIYDEADLNFSNNNLRSINETYSDYDLFKVKKNGEWIFVDSNGKEFNPNKVHKYEDVAIYKEGMCRVSTIKIGFNNLAYFSDHEDIMGYWGYVDENGNEVIKPQFIYANDFDGGIAIAAKGEWTRNEKWNNEHSTGKLWTEYELWGAVDKNGNEVIPFVFDEICFFIGRNDVFKAHYGGWESGAWGVIDNKGNWLAEPIFARIGYDYFDGLFSFYESNNDDKFGEPLDGVYDVKQNKVIYEPRFADVDICDDGFIGVYEYVEELGREVYRIYDRNGNMILNSNYSLIFSLRNGYRQADIWDNVKKEYISGFLDVNYKEVIPCEHRIWGEYSIGKNRYVFRENGKFGIKTFNNEILIPPIYHNITDDIDNDIIVADIGNKDNSEMILIDINNNVLINNSYYNISISKDRKKALCYGRNGCDMYYIKRKGDINQKQI